MAQPLFLSLRQEVDDLIQLQIDALTQRSALDPSPLHDCQARDLSGSWTFRNKSPRLRKESILRGTTLRPIKFSAPCAAFNCKQKHRVQFCLRSFCVCLKAVRHMDPYGPRHMAADVPVSS